MFDLARIAAHPFVAQLEHRAEIGSTNDLALKLAAAGRLTTPALVLAERQTAGRGRGANRWWAADGALTFSLALDPSQMNLPAERWPQVSLATAVAIVTALEPFAPGVRFGVKWPNDVHAGGKKISGILVEAPNLAGQKLRRIIVGVGVNVNNSWANAPPELRAGGAALGDLTGEAHDMTDVLLAVLEEIEDRLGQLAGRDPRLADAWQSLCVLRGRHVEVDLGQRLVAGACAGIDADGALVLDQPEGTQRLFGGTVRSIR
jgi:BirA family biotin operon repressor/biotin-[acetyl-CoA-carboxylase] ligase